MAKVVRIVNAETAPRAKDALTENTVSTDRAVPIPAKVVRIQQKDAPLTDRAALTENTATAAPKARHAPTESTVSTDRAVPIPVKDALTDRTVRTENTATQADSTAQHVLREDARSLAVNLDSRRTSIQPLRRRASTE